MFRLILPIFYIHCNKSSECLHGECLQKRCSCNLGWVGKKCEIANCAYGNYNLNGMCTCPNNYIYREGICTKNCNNGVFLNISDMCICKKNWRDKSYLETLPWGDNACTEFICDNTTQCRDILPNITNPSCPIKNWGCDCGFKNADYHNERGKCIGFFKVLSIRIFHIYLLLVKQLFNYGLIVSLLSIPFGKRSPYCKHYKKVNNCLRRYIECDGSCITSHNFSILNDLAFSLYVIKLTLWLYVIISVVLILLSFLWSIISWIIILLNYSIIYIFIKYYLKTRHNNDHQLINVNGKIYYEIKTRPPWNYKYPIIWPIYILYNTFPLFPENLHGGIFGIIIGTHIWVDSYRGNNKIIDILGFTKFRRDYHSSNEWNDQISHILKNQLAYNSITDSESSLDTILLDNWHTLLDVLPVTKYVNYPYLNKIINKEDIDNARCWCCNEITMDWVVWSCNHAICQTCSEKLIEMNLYCPLCKWAPRFLEYFSI